MRIELTRVGLLFYLANHYTTLGAQVNWMWLTSLGPKRPCHPGFHLHRSDQVYCLVPEALQKGNINWAKNFMHPLRTQASTHARLHALKRPGAIFRHGGVQNKYHRKTSSHTSVSHTGLVCLRIMVETVRQGHLTYMLGSLATVPSG